MELKIGKLTEIEKKVFNKGNSKSLKKSFQNTLETAKAFSSSFDPLGHLSDKALNSVEKFEKIFDMKITNSNFKGNGYLDIMRIIRDKGNRLSPDEVKDFREALVQGVNSDLIEFKDAEEAIKWLNSRIQAFKIKDNEIREILNVIDNIRENIHEDIACDNEK